MQIIKNIHYVVSETSKMELNLQSCAGQNHSIKTHIAILLFLDSNVNNFIFRYAVRAGYDSIKTSYLTRPHACKLE